MELLDFTEFDAFNELRKKMGTKKLGYFELFDPAVHLTGLERSELETSGRLLRINDLRVLPDRTLALKNSRVIVYYPDENWHRDQREYPTFHLAYCSQLDEISKASPDFEWLATTKIAEDYDLIKFRNNGEVSLVSHGFAVCKHCLHSIRYKNFDEFRNRRRGHSETVLKQFHLKEFYRLYQQYPLSFRAKPE